MALEGGGAERGAGRLLHQIGGREQRALAVDMGAEPLENRREFAAADPVGDVRQRLPQCREKLRRDQRAQGVGREIAPGAVIPMNVLQAAVTVGGRLTPIALRSASAHAPGRSRGMRSRASIARSNR